MTLFLSLYAIFLAGIGYIIRKVAEPEDELVFESFYDVNKFFSKRMDSLSFGLNIDQNNYITQVIMKLFFEGGSRRVLADLYPELARGQWPDSVNARLSKPLKRDQIEAADYMFRKIVRSKNGEVFERALLDYCERHYAEKTNRGTTTLQGIA